jgi:hypothetical protein
MICGQVRVGIAEMRHSAIETVRAGFETLNATPLR